MKIYLVKEHMALAEGQRETVTAAYFDKKNAEKDARSHLESHYTHWMVDAIDVKDARSFFKERNGAKKPTAAPRERAVARH